MPLTRVVQKKGKKKLEGRAGERRVTSCLHGEGGTEGKAAFGVHAHASATAIHAALTPPWEVARIPLD